jgi:hypothetical protein
LNLTELDGESYGATTTRPQKKIKVSKSNDRLIGLRTMKARLKNIGLMLGLMCWASTSHAQLTVDWTAEIDIEGIELPFQYKDFKYFDETGGIYVYESRFSASLIVFFSFRNEANPDQALFYHYHISPDGQNIGKLTGYVDFGDIENGTIWEPYFVGVDWMIVNKWKHQEAVIEYEYRIATGDGRYVTANLPPELQVFTNKNPLFGMRQDLIWFYSTDRSAREPNTQGLYRVDESSGILTIQKFSAKKRVVTSLPNSSPQTSISRADNGITLSTDTEDGQSYRIQSSQDLKQWRDEEIIKGDGEKKSVQRQTDKPKEFLRVVEE